MSMNSNIPFRPNTRPNIKNFQQSLLEIPSGITVDIPEIRESSKTPPPQGDDPFSLKDTTKEFSKSLGDLSLFTNHLNFEDSDEEELSETSGSKFSADDNFFGKDEGQNQKQRAWITYRQMKSLFQQPDQNPDPFARGPVSQNDFYQICYDLLYQITSQRETKRQLTSTKSFLSFLNGTNLGNRVRVVTCPMPTEEADPPTKPSRPCLTFQPGLFSDLDLVKIANTAFFTLSNSSSEEARNIFLPKKKLHIQNLKTYLTKQLREETHLRKSKGVKHSWTDLGISLISGEANYAGRGYQEDQMAINPDVSIFIKKSYTPRRRTSAELKSKNENNNNINNNNINNNNQNSPTNNTLPSLDININEEEEQIPISCFGVYDGHSGKKASDYCRTYLTPNIVKSSYWPNDILQAIHDGYVKTNHDFDKTIAPPDQDGTTATNVIITKDKIYSGNVGDSEAFLYRGNEIIPLTFADSGSDQSERDRVEKAGGKVMKIVGNWRVSGVLAVTRSIGDFWLKRPQNLVIEEPHVFSFERSDKDDFLIIASDGLWEKFKPKEVNDWVKKYLSNPENDPQQIASQLILEAIERETTDNVTVIIVVFKKQ